MTIDLRFPEMSDDYGEYDKAMIVDIRASVGERVKMNQPLVRYRFASVSGLIYAIHAPHAATVLKICVTEGQVVSPDQLGIIVVKKQPQNLDKAIHKVDQELHSQDAIGKHTIGEEEDASNISTAQKRLVQILQRKPEKSEKSTSISEAWTESDSIGTSSSKSHSSSYLHSEFNGFSNSAVSSKYAEKSALEQNPQDKLETALTLKQKPETLLSSDNGQPKKHSQEDQHEPVDLKVARKNLLQDIENTISDMKLDMLTHLFIQRLISTTKKDFTGKAKNNLIDLHNVLKDQFEMHQFGDLDRLAQTSAKVQRINEYETVMDAYERKIKDVRNHPDLDEEDREEKLEYWKRLRDRDVSAFESGET